MLKIIFTVRSLIKNDWRPRDALRHWFPNSIVWGPFTLFYVGPQGAFEYMDYTYRYLFC